MINNKKIRNLLSIILILFSFSAHAQKTGSFNETINFNSEQRTLSFFVPADYDSTRPYKLMVALHGLGDNSTNMRNYLSSGTTFITYMPNTIMVCPDGGSDAYRSFNIPAGDEEIIQASIDFAAGNYNIDRNFVILEGFSLGGRSALQYGLMYPEKFKGLLLHTPAVQGVKDALSGGGFGSFKYENAPKIPIYITHGADDVNYAAPIDTTYEQLILNNGKVRFYRYAGMGHTVPSFQRTQNFLSFLDEPSFSDNDMEVVKVITPARSCNPDVPATALVRNLGKLAVNSITFDYTLNGSTKTHTWNGNLAPFQHAYVSFPLLPADPGDNAINIKVKFLNTTREDTITSNNEKATNFLYTYAGLKLPVTEGFEGSVFPPANWLLQRSGDYFLPWTKDTDTKKDGAASIVTFNSIFIFDNTGRKEEILSPILDLSSVSNPGVSFDLTYNYIRYTPPYFTNTTDFADTLQVLISTDCGKTFTSLYKKGGKDLATFNAPILNPLSLEAIDFSPADSNWRKEQIDLSNYNSSTEAVIKFSYISALGGLISIDNISFSTPSGIKEKTADSNFKLFPNPANDKITLVAGDEDVLKVNIIDISGRNVLTLVNENRQNAEMTINTTSLHDGFYIFEVITANGINTNKVLIKR